MSNELTTAEKARLMDRAAEMAGNDMDAAEQYYTRMVNSIGGSMVEKAGIVCVSDDCAYFMPHCETNCGLRMSCLRRGTCRFYAPDAKLDRTDLGDGDYLKFVSGS